MTVLLYILAAYGAFNLLFLLGWYLNTLRKRRRARAAKPVEEDSDLFDRFFGNETIELDPGDAPLPPDSYLDDMPTGMLPSQHSVDQDSDLDPYTQLISAIATQYRAELVAAHPHPPKPEEEKSDDEDDEGVQERNQQRTHEWYMACQAVEYRIDALLEERLSPLGALSMRELRKLMKKPKA